MRTLIVVISGLLLWPTLLSAQEERLLEKFDSLFDQANYMRANELIDRWFTNPTGDVPFAILKNRKAELQIVQGQLQSAEALLLSIDASDPLANAVTLSNLGFLYLNKGRYDKALENLRSSLSIFNAEDKQNSRDGIKCLTYIASVYLAMGEIKQAEEHELMALQFKQNLFAEKSPEIASSFNNLGVIYLNNDPKRSFLFYEKALGIYQSIYDPNHPRIAITYTNLGITLNELKRYAEAITSFERALKTWEYLYPDGHPSIALVQRNLGRAHFEMKSVPISLICYNKAIEQYERLYGTKHPDLAGAFNELGTIHLNSKQYDRALEAFQKSLLANVPEFESRDLKNNPGGGTCYNPVILIYTLNLKAEALEARYAGKSLRLSDLKQALVCLHLCDSVIDEVRHQRPEEADKLSLGALSDQVYENAVRICFSISENVFDKRKYLERAFLFSEKSKSVVLQEAISDSHAKIFTGIPPDVLEQERMLKSTISLLTRQLAQSVALPSEKGLRQQLYNAHTSYNDFVRKLERVYPQYYDLKFSKKELNVQDLQRSLPNDCAIISYFIAEKSRTLYSFTITPRTLDVQTHSLPDDFERTLIGFRNSLIFGEPITFTKTCNRLSSLLLPHLSNDIKNLIVIPSGKLSNLPFEVLFTRQQRKYDFSTSPFLILSYGVSYLFAANLLQVPGHLGKGRDRSALLCAPVNFVSTDSIQPLPATESEVRAISALFEGSTTSAFFSEATEGLIKSDVISEVDFIHLATHGVVDELNPELSRLFLNPSSDQDGLLYFGEIYNLRLRAQLIVLSACQTGLGKFSRGEGIIGLSRALLYAGAKNVVVSYWNVADDSTAILMEQFYKNFLSRPDIDFSQALRLSKVRMIKDKNYNAPYYWAPFILVGGSLR